MVDTEGSGSDRTAEGPRCSDPRGQAGNRAASACTNAPSRSRRFSELPPGRLVEQTVSSPVGGDEGNSRRREVSRSVAHLTTTVSSAGTAATGSRRGSAYQAARPRFPVQAFPCVRTSGAWSGPAWTGSASDAIPSVRSGSPAGLATGPARGSTSVIASPSSRVLLADADSALQRQATPIVSCARPPATKVTSCSIAGGRLGRPPLRAMPNASDRSILSTAVSRRLG